MNFVRATHVCSYVEKVGHNAEEIIDELKLAVLNAMRQKEIDKIEDNYEKIDMAMCLNDLFHSNLNTIFLGNELNLKYGGEYSDEIIEKSKSIMLIIRDIVIEIFKNEKFEETYLSDRKFEEVYKKYNPDNRGCVYPQIVDT